MDKWADGSSGSTRACNSSSVPRNSTQVISISSLSPSADIVGLRADFVERIVRSTVELGGFSGSFASISREASGDHLMVVLSRFASHLKRRVVCAAIESSLKAEATGMLRSADWSDIPLEPNRKYLNTR